MKWSRRLLVGIVCLLAVGIDGVARHRMAAAANAPTVGIHRNPVFIGPVRTGDFNGDGFADLVGSTADPANPSGPAIVTVGLSRADGSLGTLIRSHVNGTVLAVGDLNADGKLDLVVARPNPDAGQPSNDIVALPGNGDGTFATPTSVVTLASYVYFAMIADFDGDGHADVAAAINDDGDNITEVVRGHGDFTFTRAAFLGGGTDDPFAGTVADLNGDGKPDIVTANGEFNSLSFYFNQGAMQFTSSQMTLAHNANDIAAADLNGDGRVDLVIASSTDPHPAYEEGYATVLLGAGGGTFAAPVDYPTAPGAYNVVLGDFNRDGIIDIATANRSEIYYDALCDPRQTWDSISILPGTTNGTFTARSDFSIGNQMKPHDTTTDRNTVESLASGDLNGDHAADLVTSNGTVFLNKAPDPNWAPTVDAGPDQTINDPGDHFVHLYATASDVDQDMLTYAWYDSGGDSIPPVPSPCFSPRTLGVHIYTVTVDDGHGHTASDSVQVDFGSGGGSGGGGAAPTVSVTAPTAGEFLDEGTAYTIKWTASSGATLTGFTVQLSTDDGGHFQPISECASLPGTATSCTWNHVEPVTNNGRIAVTVQDSASRTATATSGRFVIRAAPGGTLSYGWSHGDIGNVGAAGSASHDGFINNGQGLTVTGSGADIWGTADAFHFVWQHMTGDFSIDTHVDSLQNVNAWTKAGLMIRAVATDPMSIHASIFVSPSKGIAYQRRTQRGGSSQSTQGPLIAAPVYLRMTRQGTRITALYRKNATDAWTVLATQLISGLGSGADVGLPVSSHVEGTLATAKFTGVFLAALPSFNHSSFGDGSGEVSDDGTTYTMNVAGTDIWGTSDNGVYTWIPTGDYNQITVRIRSVGNTDPWAKAGVMIREGQTADAKHADAIVSPGKGIAMQYRSTTGGASASAVQINGSAPVWLRITRSASSTPGGPTSFQTSYSTDFAVWRLLSNSISFPMAHDALIGIVGASHKAGAKTTIVLDDVRLEQ